MSEADKQMPLEIWTDINGNATRTQFKGGVKYIRADERDRLRAALEVAGDAICSEFCGSGPCHKKCLAVKAALTPVEGGQDE